MYKFLQTVVVMIMILVVGSIQMVYAQSKVSKLQTGDQLVYEGVNFGFQGNEKTPFSYTATLRITPEGDREYTSERGVVLFSSTHGFKSNSSVTYTPSMKFDQVPANVQPGQEWRTSYTYTSTNYQCGSVRVSLRGRALEGVSGSIKVDGSDTKLTTIPIQYRGTWSCTHSSTMGDMIINILYSRELDEMVEYSRERRRSGSVVESTTRILREVMTNRSVSARI